MPMPTAFRSLSLAFGLCLGSTALPSQAQTPAPNRILIDYGAPKDPAHEPLLRLLRANAVLERVRTVFSPVRLSRPLTFRTAGCDGEANAWFEDSEVVLCYELIADIAETALARRLPAGLSEEDAIRGPLIDVLLHEGAHALFAYLETPILGKEEDAADQISAYVMLSLGRTDILPVARGIVHSYLRQAGYRSIASLKRRKLRLVDGKLDADVHSTPLQRMYGFLCLAYGAEPDLFRDIVRSGALPDDRAEGCADEFRQVDRAFRTLILPHIDMDVLRAVLAKDTLSIGR
jgi:hypothetical protein